LFQDGEVRINAPALATDAELLGNGQEEEQAGTAMAGEEA